MMTVQSGPVRALVVDDDLVVRLGLTSLLEASGRVAVAGEASDGDEALALARQHLPDVVLLDVRLPRCDGLSVLPRLVELARVLMVTSSDEPAVIAQALRAGATGYLVHGQFTPAECVDAVVAAAAGRHRVSPPVLDALVEHLRSVPKPGAPGGDARNTHGLSRREVEIMEQIVRGRWNGHIARVLYISEKTVKNHINRVYAKLGTRNRAESIALWLGLADPADG
jgi:DNA-binding NarL/FixJ family response regulator